jgi:hypothetical protein
MTPEAITIGSLYFRLSIGLTAGRLAALERSPLRLGPQNAISLVELEQAQMK